MEKVSKPCQDQFLHPILVHLIEKKENIGSQMGHPQKNILKIIVVERAAETVKQI
jgi:hypothetical protein